MDSASDENVEEGPLSDVSLAQSFPPEEGGKGLKESTGTGTDLSEKWNLKQKLILYTFAD